MLQTLKKNGMLSVMIQEKEALAQIEHIYVKVIAGKPVTERDVDALFFYIESGSPKVHGASAFVCVHLPKLHILDLLDLFKTLTYKRKKALIPYLVTTAHVEVYVFLLDLLVQTKHRDLIDTLVSSLSKSEYMMFPLILQRLGTSAKSGIVNLQLLLKKLDFETIELYLSALPFIPHETIFRRVYGDAAIERVKR